MITARKNTGLPFQEKLVVTARQYQSRGLVRLRKVDPPTKVLGSGAKRKIIFLENPFLDFVGAWTERGGRAVFIEAKSTSSPRLNFDSSSGVTSSQMDALRHWHNAGAVSFVLWEYNGLVRLVTAAELAAARDRYRRRTADAPRQYKFLHWHEVPGDPLPQGLGFVLVDFLPEMRRLFGAQSKDDLLSCSPPQAER